MALVACPGCGKMISDKAEKCFSCGTTFTHKLVAPCSPPDQSGINQPPPIQSPVSAPTNVSRKRPSRLALGMVVAGVILFVMIMVGAFVGFKVFHNDPIRTVQTGVMEYDKSVTVGDALNGYQYFDERKWSQFMTTQNRQVVEFTGKMGYEKYIGAEFNGVALTKEQVAEAKRRWNGMEYFSRLQFTINKDNESFELSYIGCVIQGKDVKTGEVNTGEVKDENLVMLDYLYHNKPDPTFWIWMASPPKE